MFSSTGSRYRKSCSTTFRLSPYVAGLNCCDVWHLSLARDRASLVDQHFPKCACEAVSLQGSGGEPVGPDERIARIVTSPASYNLTTGQFLTGKLTSVYSVGLSVIREGASDQEIRETVSELTNLAADNQSLVGAVVASAREVRDLQDAERWFAVYATDAGTKQRHADLAGTFPTGLSNTQKKKAIDNRRYRLAEMFEKHLVLATDIDELLVELRAAGI